MPTQRSEETDETIIEQLASALLEARRAGRAIGGAESVEALRPLEAGLRATSRMTSLLAAEGVLVAGFKLGALDLGAQRALGLDGPLVAPFYDEWTMSSGDQLPASRLIAPKLESEIGFRLEHGRWTPVACIEIVDSRFTGWSGRGGQVLADFGMNGAIIQGSKLGDSEDLTFELLHDGVAVTAGPASIEPARQRLKTLVGDTDARHVASGSLHPFMTLEAGDWTLRFSKGGDVSLTIAGAVPPP